MSANAICGNCASVLENPSAPCRRCGARPSTPAFVRPRKSPLMAAGLAIVPGLGHLYIGQWRKAVGFALGAGALEFFGFDLDLTAIGALLGVPIELGGAGIWLYSIYDAYHSAKRTI
jgi:hypothetical protein